MSRKSTYLLFSKYYEPHKDPEKPDKIKRLYNNYEARKNCKARNKCCPSTNTQNHHKTLFINANEPKNRKNKNIKTNIPKNQALKNHSEYSKNNSK